MNDYKELINKLRHYVETADENIYGLCINSPKAMIQAADAIEQLVKERDAAIKDLNFLKAHPHGACVICKHNAFSPTKDGCRCMACDYGGDFVKFEWRGVSE